MTSTTLSDLPAELLHDIFGYMHWKEIINSSRLICKKIKAIVERDYFWQKRLEGAIQLPYSISSLPRFKGVPTMRIFLAITKARSYTWGSSEYGKLGHSYPVSNAPARSNKGVGIPLEIRTWRNVFVVDIQASGWSTHLLTFDGVVYSYGALSSNRGMGTDKANHAVKMDLDTPIARISAGRNHLIALSKKGEIYSYETFSEAPRLVRFIEHEIVKSNPYSSSTEAGKVRKVVGGWDCSGALVYGLGLIIWKHDKYLDDGILKSHGIDPAPEHRVVQENLITPPILGPQDHQRNVDQEREKEIIDFILIEGFIVFVTAGGRVYCLEETGGIPVLPPVFLPHFSVHEPTDEEIADREGYRNKKADRISGFFRKFAVYNRNGLVHVGDTTLLRKAVEQDRRAGVTGEQKEEIKPLAIPSLNKFGTIAQIVFGDYHSHAVTQDGRLLSWGVESQNCGCLGIGNVVEAERRGVVWQGWHGRNGTLDEAVEVFFHDPPYPKSCYPPKGEDGRPQWDAAEKQEGAEEEVRLDKREFCVLGVSAAGWHSAALVLPVTDYLLFGTEPEERSPEPSEIIAAQESSNPALEVDANTLPPPFVGHGGIEGVSSVARAMRGGVRGGVRGDFMGRLGGNHGLSSSGVRVTGLDEEMRQRNQVLSHQAGAGEPGDDRHPRVRRQQQPPAV